MKPKHSTSYLAVLAAGVFALTAIPSVQAVPSLTVADSAGNTSGIVTAPGGGVVTFVGTIGKWNINVDTGMTKPAIGSASSPSMDLNFVDTFTDLAGTATAGQKVLTLTFSDTDFTAIGIGLLKTIGGTLGTGVSLTYQAFYSTTNTLFAQTTGAGATLAFTSTPFSGVNGGTGPGTSPYSLTQVITLTYTGGATSGGVASSGDATLAVPEGGATSAMLGIAVLTLGLIRRRKA